MNNFINNWMQTEVKMQSSQQNSIGIERGSADYYV